MNWEQLQKDVEAMPVGWSLEGDTLYGKEHGFTVELAEVFFPEENEFEPECRRAISRAPDLAALALAGKRVATAAENVEYAREAYNDTFPYGDDAGAKRHKLAEENLERWEQELKAALTDFRKAEENTNE